MQNKGAIRLLAIALALVCLYQLSFTIVTSSVQNKAEKYAREKVDNLSLQSVPQERLQVYKDSLKNRFESAYLDSMSGEVVYNFLGLRKYTFNECKGREINLGLDLKGGMNVTLEVSVEDIIKSLANHSTDTTFNKALKLAKQMQKNSQEDYITLFGRAFNQLDPNGRLAAIFNTVDLRDEINFNSTNDEVLKVIRKEAQGAIDNSFNILRTRIDRFGVTQPNIQQLGTTGRILVELPGVKDPERVRKLLQGTANLQFFETYENSEVYPYLLKANERLKEIREAEKALNDTVIPVGERNMPADTSTPEITPEEKDTAGGEVSLINQLESDSLASDTAALAGGNEALMQNYPLFAVLQPNVTRDNQLVPGSVIGMAQYKDTAQVDEYLHMQQIRSLFPRNIRFYWGVKPYKYDKTGTYFELHAIKITTRDGQPPLDGDVITNARAEFGQNRANAEVTMTMNGEGAKTWARLTKENVGKCIAIVLDGYVYSAPRVNQEIKGGNSSITGDFTITEAQDLANVLKSGKLPAPARIIQEAIVGPSLGQESIHEGFSSFAIAFVLVLIYMIFYYSRAGWIADLALVSNVFFIMGVLASLGAVLTLPGIAGIVLTMGMAVDANVIIYERIKEEIRAGKGVKLAISEGYKNAYSAIIDGNLTTLLTGVVLFIFGTGPIQGFATTLIIGILTSLFSAIFISRLIFEGLLNKNKSVKFATRLTENILKNPKVDFLGRRKIFYVISSTIILIGLISIFTRGFNLGVDFMGGRTYIVKFEKPVNTVEVQKQLAAVFDNQAPEVKTFGSENQVKITTKYLIDQNNTDKMNVDSIVDHSLYQGLLPVIGHSVSFEKFTSDYWMSSQKVGPTIADDIKVSAVWAIVLSLIGIFLYIFFRFKNWRFGLGGVAALFHDALIVLGLFSLLYQRLPFSLELDQAFIAAILTVIGYSINDTVIVFDRIREYVGLYPKRERLDIYNAALNSTLGRTLNTALTTFFVLLVIFIFGGEVIRGFVFALMIGVAVGTYSSLFIATPIVFDTIHSNKPVKAKAVAGKKK